MKRAYHYIRNFIYTHIPGLYIRLHLFKMWLQGADKYQRWLEKGDFYMYRGIRVRLGQPVKYRIRGIVKTKWVKGIYYDFGKRKVSALYSDKPIKGLSEKFINNGKKKK